MKMDWKNSNRNRVVEAGQYHVEVKGWKEYKATTGNDCIIIEHTIIGPEASGEVGETISDFLTLTENTAWKIGLVVGTCGINVSNLPDMDTNSEEFKNILNLLKGRRMWVDVTKGVHNGKDVNKISEYVADTDQEELTVQEEVPDFIKHKVK